METPMNAERARLLSQQAPPIKERIDKRIEAAAKDARHNVIIGLDDGLSDIENWANENGPLSNIKKD